MYVKPEFRKKGIASKMVNIFEEHLTPTISFDDNVVYMVSSRGDSTKILRKNLKVFTTSRNDGNISVWRDEAKDYVRYNSFLSRKENINLITKGVKYG
jgi:GNAT superfamily N-acetyltransferase